MSKYVPLHCHSHYSLLDGLSKPEDIVKRIDSLELDACALTDHGNVAGSIKFMSAMKKAGKKPILGCELYISRKDAKEKNTENRKMDHLVVLAKNDAGWRDLLQIIALSNSYDQFYHKPRIDKNQLAHYAQNGNLIAFSGHLGSNMASILYSDGSFDDSSKARAIKEAEWFRDTFGKENFYLEVQLMDRIHNPEQVKVAEMIREVGLATNIPCIGTGDAHYARREDAVDQRILLCTNMRTTLKQANRPEFGLYGFFKSDEFHIHSYDDMASWNTEEELANTIQVADQIEEYTDVLKSPKLPAFDCPNGMNPDEYLRELCRVGWRDKIEKNIPKEKHAEYAERVKQELKVLQGADLSSYFLIVSDIVNEVKDNGWLSGPGRGSAAGCLVSYLINITAIDPIRYGLIFERFYNAGRNTGGRVSMPDIDIDVPKYAREYVINYIRNKYGADRVGQMITFQTMKGRGALKDVMRAHGGVSFEEMNQITKNIIEEHRISDELQKMKEDTGDSSIIRWCLENTPKKLKEWVYIEDGEIKGPFADRFVQAMRLEGVKSAQSKHPAGIVIAPEPLANMCPLVLDSETKQHIVGLEMDDVEDVGNIKYDVLGINLLDKVMGCAQDLATGEISEIR